MHQSQVDLAGLQRPDLVDAVEFMQVYAHVGVLGAHAFQRFTRLHQQVPARVAQAHAAAVAPEQLGVQRAFELIENFKIGTMEKWGIGFAQMQQRFERLVWCRVSGFGADGPLGAWPGYDAAIQAMTGLMSVNGERDGGPLRVGLPVVDMVTGMNAVIGVMLDLHERQRSGLGQLVDAALYDSGISLLHPHAANWFMDGKTPQRSGNALATALMEIGVPAAPVQAVDAALAHPHTLHRQLRVQLPGYQGVGSPIKLSRTPATYRHAPLTPGEQFD